MTSERIDQILDSAFHQYDLCTPSLQSESDPDADLGFLVAFEFLAPTALPHHTNLPPSVVPLPLL